MGRKMQEEMLTLEKFEEASEIVKKVTLETKLVYDMYNGTYSNFTQVSVEKFLRADVNATKAVDHADAVAIVNQFK